MFKKIASSAIGKIILIAAAIYTGGVALGHWGASGPLSGIHGAWSGVPGLGAGAEKVAAQQLSAGIDSAIATYPSIQSEVVASNARIAASGGGDIITTPGSVEGGMVNTDRTGKAITASEVKGAGKTALEADAAPISIPVEPTPEVFAVGDTGMIIGEGNLVTDLGTAGTQPSLLGNILGGMRGFIGTGKGDGSGILGFMKNYPIPTAMVMSGLGNALAEQPDPYGDRQKVWNQNWAGIENVKMPFSPYQNALAGYTPPSRSRNVLQRHGIGGGTANV